MSNLRIIALLVLFAACDGPLATGVVQETGQPCTLGDDCTCERAHLYNRDITRTCSGIQAAFSICADEPVCESVIDALAAEVAACTEPQSPFVIDVGACP